MAPTRISTNGQGDEPGRQLNIYAKAKKRQKWERVKRKLERARNEEVSWGLFLDEASRVLDRVLTQNLKARKGR